MQGHLGRFRRQLTHDGVYKGSFMGMLETGQEMESLPVFKLTDDLGEALHAHIEGEKIFKDDPRQQLDLKLVAAARDKELEYLESKVVWKMWPAEESGAWCRSQRLTSWATHRVRDPQV